MTDETPISYEAAVLGTPVLSSTGAEIGTLEHVLEVPDLDLFDGIVVTTKGGLRFIDADQVGEITRSQIRCHLDDAQASNCRRRTGRPYTGSTRWRTRGRACTTAWAGCSAARAGSASRISPGVRPGPAYRPQGAWSPVPAEPARPYAVPLAPARAFAAPRRVLLP